MYKGVRAGGGIGDEIEPPDGDDYEVYRIMFDITFFFFVIIILLAIIQGLLVSIAYMYAMYLTCIGIYYIFCSYRFNY